MTSYQDITDGLGRLNHEIAHLRDLEIQLKALPAEAAADRLHLGGPAQHSLSRPGTGVCRGPDNRL